MEIRDKSFGEERALYGESEIKLTGCRFEGEEDGESALKECGVVEADKCRFDLRYPLWHDNYVRLNDCEMTANCRAALWYTENVRIKNSRMHGIKAVRECRGVHIFDSDIDSPEFGWMTDGLEIADTKAVGEYFCMRAKNLDIRRLDFTGKYSFQYVKNAHFRDCRLDTKDAFWHTENVTVENCVVKGEYLGWYSKNLTFIRCEIIGTQPLCYCNKLRLIDCVMTGADLAFERSHVVAKLHDKIDSIKNPYKGYIIAPAVGDIIRDDERARAKIIIDEDLMRMSKDRIV